MAINMLSFEWYIQKTTQPKMSLDLMQTCIPNKDSKTRQDHKAELDLQEWADATDGDISIALLNLAKALQKANIISVPRNSWKEIYLEDPNQTETDIDTKAQEAENVHHTRARRSSDFFELKEKDPIAVSRCVIHPDKEDHNEWDFFTRIQTKVGNCFVNHSDWNTPSQRSKLRIKAVSRVGFIFAAYKVEFWYWEMLEMLRK